MKISVIVPVYNAEKTITRCVESIVRNRKSNNIEIILVEDCSKDKSLKLCQQLSRMYEGIICIHNNQNQGVSYTRNRGLDLATGKYVMFVDSDDWVDTEYFSAFFDVIDKNELLLPICGYVNHDEKNNGSTDIFGWEEFEDTKIESLKTTIQSLYDHRLMQQLWNKVFVLDLINQYNIRFDETISIGEDFRFILEYIKKCEIQKVCLINKPLYHYMRDQSGSLMYHVGCESIEESIKNLKILYEIIGYRKDEIVRILDKERENQKEIYAYLIFHNMGMSYYKKKKLILALDDNRGKTLFRKNRIVFLKEKIVLILKRIGCYGK